MPSISMHGKQLLHRFPESYGYDIVPRGARNGPPRPVLLQHATAEVVEHSRFVALIESTRVPVVTIAQLLERHPETHNLVGLQIDAEGHYSEELQSAVAAVCLPRMISYEHKHLAFSDQVACLELLASHGYSFCSGKSDTVAAALAG